MKILCAGMKHDYGIPERGLSFEHYNFYDSLANMRHEIIYFDFMTLIQQHSREWMNHRLLEITKSEKPDLLFAILFTDQFEPDTIRPISEKAGTMTLNWFCDDHWRFDDYSRHWAPCFNWVVTTAESALPKYAKIGYKNVIKSQWACNHFLYRKLDLPLTHDVTFVGQPHGDRRKIITTLREAGIQVKVWGTGWEEGRLTQEEMIRVFNQSRINLNLSNASVTRSWRKWFKKEQQQIKGRNFEVPGCGGFLLTGAAENLSDYYEDGKEVVVFKDARDLFAKIRAFSRDEKSRARIAKVGHKRTLAEHTYEYRFKQIFARIGLDSGRPHPRA